MDTILKTPHRFLERRSRSITGSRWRGLRGLGRRAWHWLVGLLVLWEKRLRDRDILRAMSAHQLMDIGLSREDALRESEKPFWRG